MAKSLAEKIVVMQAAQAGKAIQYHSPDGEWYDCHPAIGPQWDWRHDDYRVKPEPRRWYVYRVCPDDTHWHAVRVTEENAKYVEENWIERVEVVEVLE